MLLDDDLFDDDDEFESPMRPLGDAANPSPLFDGHLNPPDGTV